MLIEATMRDADGGHYGVKNCGLQCIVLLTYNITTYV